MTARIFSNFFRWLAAAALLVFSVSSAAAQAPRQAEELLHASYRDNLSRLENNSFGLRLAETGYFATLGSGKVGFTVTGTDGQGQPVHVGGARGGIEHNAVRYYFAIQTFLETLNTPADQRFSSRISDWYALTNRYPRQLFELEREDYLAFKTREHQNQLLLQRDIETSPP